MDEDERAIIDAMDTDPEMIYIKQLEMYTVQEYRLMKAINKYRELEDKGGLYISGTVQTQRKRTFKTDEEREQYEEIIRKKIAEGKRMPGEEYTIQTTTQATIEMITRLQRELTYVQGNKTKALEGLNKYRFEKQKLESSTSGSDAVDDWVAAMLDDDDEEGDFDDEP